jgi:hypothetical protein
MHIKIIKQQKDPNFLCYATNIYILGYYRSRSMHLYLKLSINQE